MLDISGHFLHSLWVLFSAHIKMDFALNRMEPGINCETFARYCYMFERWSPGEEVSCPYIHFKGYKEQEELVKQIQEAL